MKGSALSGARACAVIARLTLRRTLRGRSLKISAVLSAVPIAYAAFLTDDNGSGLLGWREVYLMMLGLLALIPPLHLAPTIAEEIEGKTFTYLWSRPLSRWTVIGGKLLALVPLLSLLLGAATVVAFSQTAGDPAAAVPGLLWRGVLGMVVATLALGFVSVGMGALLPRQALASSAIYVLVFDLPVGALPFELHNVSITYQARQIAQVVREPAAMGSAMVWALAIGLVWLAVGVWRITVAEYATDK